jgi:hypothetical protein
LHFKSSTLLAAALLVTLAAPPASALGRCIGCGGGTPAPGPIAGAALGCLVLAGGYYMLRRWRKQNPGE